MAYVRRRSSAFSRGKSRFRGVSGHSGRWEARIGSFAGRKNVRTWGLCQGCPCWLPAAAGAPDKVACHTRTQSTPHPAPTPGVVWHF